MKRLVCLLLVLIASLPAYAERIRREYKQFDIDYDEMVKLVEKHNVKLNIDKMYPAYCFERPAAMRCFKYIYSLEGEQVVLDKIDADFRAMFDGKSQKQKWTEAGERIKRENPHGIFY